MCNPGKLASAAFTLNPIEAFSKTGEAFQPKLPKPPTLKKPPKPVEPDITLAQKHAKEAAIGAYGYSDTVLTSGKGIGTSPGKSLWKNLGGS